MQSNTDTDTCRIIVANQPRLFRELLYRALQNVPGLQVVAVTANFSALLPLIAATGAQWVIISLTHADTMPLGIESLWRVNPALRILALAIDGSHAELVWAEHQHEHLQSLLLDELIHVLCPRASPKRTWGYDVYHLGPSGALQLRSRSLPTCT